MKKSFGDLLRELREDNNISQQELADVLGVGRSAIGNYESGIRKPDMELLEAIADYFNVDMDYLYGKTDIKNSYRENLRSSNFPPTIAAHLDGAELSETDIEDIADYIEFVKQKRAKQ